MKKYLIGVAVLLLVGFSIWLAPRSQAQIPWVDTGYGNLYCYDGTNCSGSYSADVGQTIQWSSDGGTTWDDGVTTGANGYFSQTLHLGAYTGPVYVRGKPSCPSLNRAFCSSSYWNYADNPGSSPVGHIYNTHCQVSTDRGQGWKP